MLQEEKQIVEELLSQYVKDESLIQEYRLRLLDAAHTYSTPNIIIETDSEFNIIKEYKSVHHYILMNGTDRFTELGLVDAINRRTSVLTTGRVLHNKQNFDKGLYSSVRATRVNNVDFVEYDETSLICNKWGIIIDKEDLSRFIGYTFMVHTNHKGSYCKIKDLANGTGVQSLHRFLTDSPKQFTKGGMVVDHINGNTLDNRKANLRVCPQKYNTLNRRKNKPTKYKATSEYMGVSKSSKNSFAMETSVLKQRIKGRCKTEIKAAKLYDVVQLALAKEYANTNFPKENYPTGVVERFRRLFLKNFRTVE